MNRVVPSVLSLIIATNELYMPTKLARKGTVPSRPSGMAYSVPLLASLGREQADDQRSGESRHEVDRKMPILGDCEDCGEVWQYS
jgi:hypothetical protein